MENERKLAWMGQQMNAVTPQDEYWVYFLKNFTPDGSGPAYVVSNTHNHDTSAEIEALHRWRIDGIRNEQEILKNVKRSPKGSILFEIKMKRPLTLGFSGHRLMVLPIPRLIDRTDSFLCIQDVGERPSQKLNTNICPEVLNALSVGSSIHDILRIAVVKDVPVQVKNGLSLTVEWLGGDSDLPETIELTNLKDASINRDDELSIRVHYQRDECIGYELDGCLKREPAPSDAEFKAKWQAIKNRSKQRVAAMRA